MAKPSINDPESLKYAKKVMFSEEYYSIEDYGKLLMVQTCLQNTARIYFLLNSQINLNKNSQITNTTIRATFYVDGKEKEVLMEKSMLTKIYAICKIYSENNKFIKILIHRTEQYDTSEILKKINGIRFFRGAFKINLNVDEFPIKTYYLEENKSYNKDNNIDDIDIEKEFFLKKIQDNPNNVNQNNFLRNSGQTQIYLYNASNNQNNNSLSSNNNNNIYLNNNINNISLVNNNNIQVNNNISQQNFFSNNINTYFNQNNNTNLMNEFNIIQKLLFKNRFILDFIWNYIIQNNNNPMKNYLLPMINDLNTINKNISSNNLNNLDLLKKKTNFILMQIENNMSQMYNNNMNQINNNNMIQMNNNNTNQMNKNSVHQINNNQMNNNVNQNNNNKQMNQFNNNMNQMNKNSMKQINNNQMNQINNNNNTNYFNNNMNQFNNNQMNQIYNNNLMNQSNNNMNQFNNYINLFNNNNMNQFNNNQINQINNNNNQMNQSNNNMSNFNNNNQINQDNNIQVNQINQANNNQVNQINNINNINQINQNNNNNINQINIINQMDNYLQPIIIKLKELSTNIDYIINLSNNNFNRKKKIENNGNNAKINEGNNEKKKERKENEENKNDNDEKDNNLFIAYEDYFPLIGLRNVGLTCYMNSILQCLLHIPQLNAFFINIYPDQKNKFKEINKETETHGRLCEEYHKIVMKIYGNQNYEYNYISPKDFNDVLSHINGQFAQFEANDAKDLLLYLFQSMHAELNYLGDKKLKNVPKCNQTIERESFNFFMTVNNNLNLSIISYLFYGIHKSTTICSECKTTLYNFQYFQFLSFPTFNFKDQIFNIYQGFKEFIKPEIMSGDNKCYCQKCKGLKNAEVTTKIYSAPTYLIINIDYGKNKKYKPKKINFGGLIDITGFTDNMNKCPNIQYKLIAVSTHIGKSGSTGHYITFCQNNENKWYEFNDSSVTETKFEYVNSNSPYILIYKKTDRTNY